MSSDGGGRDRCIDGAGVSLRSIMAAICQIRSKDIPQIFSQLMEAQRGAIVSESQVAATAITTTTTSTKLNSRCSQTSI